MKEQHGFTLVEVLAAIVLVSAATVAIVRTIAASSDAQELSHVVSRITELDRQARALSKSEGSAQIELAEDRTLLLVGRSSKEAVSTVRFPASLHLGFWKMRSEADRTHDERARALRFDASGRTERYRIEASIGQATTRLVVSGLTGCAVPEEAP